MAITKTAKQPAADYQQWLGSELSNGDIIDVFNSLGRKVGRSMIIESGSTDIVLSFNVEESIRVGHKEAGNNFARFSPGYSSQVKTTEGNLPQITFTAGGTYSFVPGELNIKDFKVITKSTDMIITFYA